MPFCVCVRCVGRVLWVARCEVVWLVVCAECVGCVGCLGCVGCVDPYRQNQSWPPQQTDSTKRFIWLGWGGADRRAKTQETQAPQVCREERLATPGAQAGPQTKNRDQTTSGFLTKSHRHQGQASQSIQQSKNKETTRGTETKAKQTLATQPA